MKRLRFDPVDHTHRARIDCATPEEREEWELAWVTMRRICERLRLPATFYSWWSLNDNQGFVEFNVYANGDYEEDGDAGDAPSPTSGETEAGGKDVR